VEPLLRCMHLELAYRDGSHFDAATVAFGGKADGQGRGTAIALAADDPQQTWSKLKSRSAAVLCYLFVAREASGSETARVHKLLGGAAALHDAPAGANKAPLFRAALPVSEDAAIASSIRAKSLPGSAP
jgi:hypothetical protein